MERYKKASNLGTVMRSIFILLVLLIIFFPVLASSATYYVDRDSLGGSCSDTNAGTSLTAPLCTIRQANNMVRAGDTVLIRAGTYSENSGRSAIIDPRSSGSAGNYITYKNYNNEKVVLTGVYQPIAFYSGNDYIWVEGIEVDGSLTSPNVVDICVAILSNYNVVKNCILHHTKTSGDALRGVWLRGPVHHNQIIGNYIHHCGHEVQVEEQLGDGIVSTDDSSLNLIEGNKIDYFGHGALDLWGQKNIVRNNEFIGSWGGACGINNVMNTPASRTVFENNIMRNVVGHGVANMPQGGVGMTAKHVIFRKNLIYEIAGSGIMLGGWYTVIAGYDKIYNNVVFRAGKDGAPEFDYAVEFTDFSPNGRILGVTLVNNVFHDNYQDGISWREQANPASQFVRKNWWQADGDPRFVSENNYNFNLQADSSAIDNGEWLTNTASAGSGTIIPVIDAGFFMDGFGIVDGDIIQLQGQTITARITNVDYVNNRITVDNTLSWTTGLGVSQPYSGSAPDIGAFEYEGGVVCVASDLNCDTKVDVSDLNIVASDFGKTSNLNNAKSDTNNDGIVDIYDVVYVASRFT